MSCLKANFKEGIVETIRENGYLEVPVKKKIKNHKYFIIKFPNGAESLVKINGWPGANNYVNYVKDEYCDDTIFVAISRWEAFKFLLKGELFNDDN
jgi:hypothetical protein